MPLAEFEEKAKKYKKVALVVAVCLVCAIFMPLIFAMVKGMLALLIAGIMGFVTVQFAPVFADMVGNLKLKMLKAEAAKNPIETLQNEYGERLTDLGEAKEAMINFGTELRSFGDEVKKFKRDPDILPDDVKDYEEQLETMNQLGADLMEKYQTAEENLKLFKKEVERADKKWKMGLAAAKMNKAAGKISGEDFIREIKTEAAFDSVSSSMNRAFAELKMAVQKKETIKHKEQVNGILEKVDLKPQSRSV